MNTATEYVITIPGRPATKGSMKCIGRRGRQAHVLIESHDTADPWRKEVARWLSQRGPSTTARAGQPLGVEVTFTLPRPQAHYRTRGGKLTGQLKPAAVDAVPTGRNTGDVDKLSRLILDALQDAGTIPDDAAILDMTSRKRYTRDGADGPDAYDVLPYPGVRLRLYALT